MNTIKISDTVSYYGSFGHGPRTTAKVVGLTLTQYPREKYGKSVQEVNDDDVKVNKVVFDLSDGHWAYASQIILPA